MSASRTYYLDTEFIEHRRRARLWGLPIGPPVATIGLISLALVASDGRTYYALNADCDLAAAWANEWVREHVLRSIYQAHVLGSLRHYVDFSLDGLRNIFRAVGQPLATIAADVLRFLLPVQWLVDVLREHLGWEHTERDGLDGVVVGVGVYYTRAEVVAHLLERNVPFTPAIWGYYADYDWVVLCQQLFGTMNELPAGLPLYCRDLKQEQDRLGISQEEKQRRCPDPANEHNALADAHWNQRFHQVLIDADFRQLHTVLTRGIAPAPTPAPPQQPTA